MKVINGKWITENGESIDSFNGGKLCDFMKRIEVFSKGKSLSNHKIHILLKILDTDDITDKALLQVRNMDKSEIAKIV
jgi:hypothetical protein